MTKTSDKIVFHVDSRVKTGSKNASHLRKEGRVPGNIYGLKQDSISISTDYIGLKKLHLSQGDTGLIYLQIDDDKKQIPVLIDEVESVKIGEGILHVSFKRVSLDVKIQAEIPVVTIGETKIDEAVVSLIKDFVLVEALPADLPENFEVDISVLTEVGQSISLADLKFDTSKISLVLGDEEEASDVTLVNVQEVKEEIEPEPEVETPTEDVENVVNEESESANKNSEDKKELDDSKEEK